MLTKDKHTSFSTRRKGPPWGRALRIRKTTHVVTMPMLCLRRKFVGHVSNSHGATARALGHAGSLQRVRRELFKFARRHSEGALTRAILAEGWLGTLRTAPQRERFEARDPCRGFIGHCTRARNVENDRGLSRSRMNTPHTANIDAGSYEFLWGIPNNLTFLHCKLRKLPPSPIIARPPLPQFEKSYYRGLHVPCSSVLFSPLLSADRLPLLRALPNKPLLGIRSRNHLF